MGPPINTWPYGYSFLKQAENWGRRVHCSDSCLTKCVVFRAVDNFRQIFFNLTLLLVVSQILFSTVSAGPVILNLDYMQGPVPLARNIRHLPCISRRTAQEGLCMFAIDCLKANGTHLGTCIDRFYFGSCCQIPDKTILPQIIGNNIEDNSIDSSSFVHPQTEDKIQSTINKIPSLFPTKEPTNEKIETTTKRFETSATVQEKHDTESPEIKTDEVTTLDNKIPSDDEKLKVTPTYIIETTTRKQSVATKTTTKITELTTEVPIKLSTFQTVSGENIQSTEKPVQNDDNELSSTISTSEKTTTTTKLPTRRPTYKPRPSYKPSNFTRPTYGLTTKKPLPTKPISTIYNSTRKPPYRPPPKRPSTKKPLPSPPRLNITILPQSTSSRPVFTRPLTPIITYINNTATTVEEKPPSKLSTPTTTTVTTTTEPATTSKPITTEKVAETLPPTTTILTSSSTSSETVMESTEKTILTSETSINSLESLIESLTDSLTDSIKQTIVPDDIVTEKETVKPTEFEINEVTETSSLPTTLASSEEPLSTFPTTFSSSTSTTPPPSTEPPSTQASTESLSTEPSSTFPPLVTWSNNVEIATKAPEKPTTIVEDETWSPITPPDGWILISTVPPKPETSSTTTTTTQEPPTTEPLTTKPQLTTIVATESESTQSVPETTIVVETVETEKPTTSEPITSTEASQTTPSVLVTQPPTTSSTSSTSTSTSSTLTSTSSTSSPTTETKQETTESSVMEFTVNVTMSPAVQMTTVQGLSTAENVTDVNQTGSTSGTVNVTTTAPSQAGVTSTATPLNLTSPSSSTPGFTTTEPVNMSDYKDVCGRRLWPQGRIVGGAKSGFGMWPWQISLRQYRTSTYLHKCGAALLNENWAITAAHCVEHVPPSELLVRLGEHDLANEDEPYGFAERRVQIVASHPHFDPATFEYDLALLRFYEPVTFQPNILPVCVPDTDEDYVGKTAYVTGWGRLYDEGPLPSVLQEVQVPVINNTACEAMYQAAGYNEHIPNIFICAGWRKGGSDSCEGDSGGPMVIQRDRDKRFVLGGVISWGIGCAEPNQPGVYTRISEFRDWINQILQF